MDHFLPRNVREVHRNCHALRIRINEAAAIIISPRYAPRFSHDSIVISPI